MSLLAGHRTIWGVWGATVTLMAVILAWISFRAMQSERDEQQLVIRSENERLALWRMESQLLPLIARESIRNSSRGVFSPRSVRMNPRSSELTENGRQSWQASQEFVRFRFHVSAGGEFKYLTEDGWEAPTNSHPVHSPDARKFSVAMSETTETQLFRPIENASGSAPSNELNDATFENSLPREGQTDQLAMGNGTTLSQTQRNQGEFLSRANVLLNNTASSLTAQNNGAFGSLVRPVIVGPDYPLVAYWQHNELLLARLVNETPEFQRAVHGCVLDWEKIRTTLCEDVRDLLPQAELVRLDNDAKADNYALASIPARLVPGEVGRLKSAFWSPMRVSLLFAWLGFGICATAVGILLLGLMRLSQRRADFVSAVSHELRTPLTTFQIYTDLLSDSESLTKEKRDRYLNTLKREATRLTGLVDNVLGFSRLETTSRSVAVESLSWVEVVESMRDALIDRAHQADMTIRFANARPAVGRLQANASALERIVFNLVDNACKYAVDADPPIIEVAASTTKSYFEIRVRDHGPGLSESAHRRLFKPFSKSATEAAQTTHGVGLGLSLSRQLARTMRGDLILEESTNQGTTFLIRLPGG